MDDMSNDTRRKAIEEALLATREPAQADPQLEAMQGDLAMAALFDSAAQSAANARAAGAGTAPANVGGIMSDPVKLQIEEYLARQKEARNLEQQLQLASAKAQNATSKSQSYPVRGMVDADTGNMVQYDSGTKQFFYMDEVGNPVPVRKAVPVKQFFGSGGAGSGGAAPAGRTKAEKDEFKVINDYRKDYQHEPVTRQTDELFASYNRVVSSAAAKTGPSDVSLLISYMKMLDPGSVVQKGEFETISNTANIPDRILNLYNNAVSGTALSDAQRREILAHAGKMWGAQQAVQKELDDRYQSFADAYGIDFAGKIKGKWVTDTGTKPGQAPTTDATKPSWAK